MSSNNNINTSSVKRGSTTSFTSRKKNDADADDDNDSVRRHHRSVTRSSSVLNGERTVKRLRLSRAVTVPETTTIYDACRKMASRKVDALLLTDSNALLCGILTDKDIALRVIAREVNLTDTPVSIVMTKNPVFVLSDAPAVEALQKMVQGKFRHLPVVENGEVIALLDITKCLYDAIARMERAAENEKAIAETAAEGELIQGPNANIEILRKQMFTPSLSTILQENSKLVVTMSATETVLDAAKRMLEFRESCAVVSVDKKPRGILTSKDILMRVIAHDLPPETTLVEKVMTQNPECATIDTALVDALHIMHDGKFLHLPVVDRDGFVIATVDVIHVTHAAVATVGNNTTGISDEATNNMIQNFLDSAIALTPIEDEDEDTHSDNSLKLASESEAGRSILDHSFARNLFSFKVEDRRGRMHRFNCETKSLKDLIAAVVQKLGVEVDHRNLPQILYEDEDHDKIILESDEDLASAVDHARLIGLKGLKLHLDFSGPYGDHGMCYDTAGVVYGQSASSGSAYLLIAAGVAVAVGIGMVAYLKRSGF